MRIYNGTNALVCLPLNASFKINVNAHSVSGDFLPSTEFITMIITAYHTNELALVVSSAFEINMCANIVGAVDYVVQSLDEAVQRFSIPKNDNKEIVNTAKKECDNCKCECECESSNTCDKCECINDDTEQIQKEHEQEEEETQPKKKNKKSKD